MTGARKAGPNAMLSVEYACDRRCQVEFDLTDVHIRNTLGTMLRWIEAAHDEAHTAEQKTYRFGDMLVCAAVMPEAVSP